MAVTQSLGHKSALCHRLSLSPSSAFSRAVLPAVKPVHYEDLGTVLLGARYLVEMHAPFLSFRSRRGVRLNRCLAFH